VDGSVAHDRRRLLEQLLGAARGGPPTGPGPEVDEAAAMARALAPIAASPEPEVTWIGVNRARVDATVESTDGRSWRVVFFTSDGREVTGLAVYQRRTYLPAPGGLAVVLNGPSGAGKSLLMDTLVAASDLPWVRFDEPTLGAVDQELLIWRESAEALHLGFVRGMAAVAAAGNRVVAAAAGLPQSWFLEAFGAVPTLYVGLHCARDVLLAREDGRDGRWGGLAESSMGVHEGWAYDLQLDSTADPADVLADRVVEELTKRRPAV